MAVKCIRFGVRVNISKTNLPPISDLVGPHAKGTLSQTFRFPALTVSKVSRLLGRSVSRTRHSFLLCMNVIIGKN